MSASAQTLTIHNDVGTFATLPSTTATLTGKAELHITGTGDPISGSVIHLNSEDAWLFMRAILPSQVVSTFLSRVRVNGAPAVGDSNVRVVQYGNGAVIIPQPSNFAPMEVFDGRSFTGASKLLRPYVGYNDVSLGPLKMAISSFRLKRGYTATIATNENGTGVSRNYVAADGDLEVGALPGALDNRIRFVRIFPWRWVSKKGSCDVDPVALKANWQYNWSISRNSTRDWEYVAIKQQPWWPGLNEDWRVRGVNHLLGFNEPDNPIEDAYKNLTPPGSVSDAVARWPELLGTGLRVGAPAVTDGGYNWIRDFINQANAAGVRVDYVPVHYYRSYWNKNDPAGAATQLYNFLKSIHDIAQRPIWVTEFNNGANWTDNAHDPDVTQNRNAIEAMINMMDSTPWIERYSIYSRVEWFRQTHYDDGAITPMGQMYRDHVAPIGYVQEAPDSVSASAHYSFNGDFRDALANGNDAMAVGAPTFGPGRYGQAAVLDGTDYLQVSASLGDSTDFGFAGWVKWNGGGNWQRVFDFGDGTSRYIFLTPRNSGGNVRFAISAGSGEQVLTGPPLTVGQWTHLAVTISGNTSKLFVNGTAVATNTGMTLNPIEVGTRTNFIGKSQFAADPLFNGELDDVRFTTSPWTDAQVAAIAASAPPQFSGNPIAAADAVTQQQYTGSIAANATGGSGVRTFTKVGGPAWLAVAPDGALTGIPTATDGGLNSFLVRVSDANGALSTTTIQINVLDPPALVARYAFDGSVNASAGSAHGSATGSPAYAAGRIASAIDLDGADDFVTLPAGIASHPEITVATWVQWDGNNNWQRIFDFGNGTEEYMFLTPRSGSNTLRFGIRRNGVEQTLNSTVLTIGQWVHVAVALGGDVGRLYVNGALADSRAITITPAEIDPASNFIGKSQWPDPLFNGRVDEFLIFNHALSGAQIAVLVNGRAPVFSANPISRPAATPGEIYEQTIAASATDPDAGDAVTYSKVSGPRWFTVSADGRISGVPAPADAGTNRFIVRATDSTNLAADAALHIAVPGSGGLLAHYQFDGNTANAVGGAAGTAVGSPAYGEGLFDRAIRLDGVDDHVQLPAGIVSSLTDFTIAARVWWGGGSMWQRIFDFGNNTNQYLVLTPRSGTGGVQFAITTSGSAGAQRIDAANPLPSGEWAHVAVSLVGNTGTLYVNGAAAASGTITLRPSSVAPALNYIGKSQYPDPLFNGLVDDFRIYSRGLSASEVSALAAPAAAVDVPDSSYAAWSAAIAFPGGLSGAGDDPDYDGLTNAWEYLFGSDPLSASSGARPQTQRLSAAALGLPGDKTYLTLRARVRKHRLGATLRAEAAASVEGLAAPDAVNRARIAGAPVADGDFEIITYYYETPIEDSPTGAGAIRLRVSWP